MSETSRASALSAIRVLVVDDEVNLRFAIERVLRRSGHLADSASTVRQAIERLRSQPYDTVVTDLRMPGGDGLELIQWLGSYSPSTKILVISAYITPEFRKIYGNQASIGILEKPVELSKLIELVEELGPRRGFYGNSIEVELFDYVQMVALSGRDKLVKVVTPISEGHIWFEHGDIVHAEFESYTGETAFYKVLAVGRGTFTEVFYTDPPKRTIMGSATGLLMEAARQMDEGTLGQDPEPPPPPPSSSDQHESSFADLNDDDDHESPLSDADLQPSGGFDPFDPTQSDPAHPVEPNDPFDMRSPPPPPPPPPEPQNSAMGLLDDPETRELMLGQFFEFEGVNGVAIISSTGKVLAESMGGNSSLVTLAGFYMRGAARIARSLGYNVFDGVIARSETGQQLIMVGMGATSAVLSIEASFNPEQVRDEIMGLD
ncbi:two component, sigma54 specific, transcriptional regulator, Fis family protein [Enhygromyxa salina]|uniref:Two component, sigma54 specific, transcriptional regulator, Fis family protein n=1 Tax=Enhygromyxa salina TaxID=215803 RepID=A0A0C1ZRM1_9BACT|nr:response regulator [Enhygromyxa salina]KIG13653.1 two component, sigma54 specific, transcriptional regulator, Fis family protein [Enhygromyxa salina]